MTDDELRYERLLKEQLMALERSYREAAAPIVKRLADLYARQPPKPFIADAYHSFTASELPRKLA